MRVLSVHNLFFVTGGADRCFFEINELLTSKGHEVIPFSTKNLKNVHSYYEKYFVREFDFDISARSIKQIRSLLNMMYSFSSKKALRKMIDETHPEVAHLHNIYSRISPSILHVIKKNKIPIVQTMHDFKFVCPNHAMFSNGSICEACRGGKFYKAFLKKCSHGSAMLSGVLALESYWHGWLKLYDKYIDAFIAPSRFMADKLAENGWDAKRIFVLPNFVRVIDSGVYSEANIDGMFLGSLIEEKGVEVLIRSLAGLKRGRFRVVGDGYLKETLERNIKNIIPVNGCAIEFAGHLNSERLKKEISMSLMVIVPSVCYENSPMAILESFSQGKPVIASRIGGIPEIVKEGETGLLFEAGDSLDLREKILEMLGNRDRAIQMGRNAREWVRVNRSPDNYFKELMSIYNKVGAKALKGI